VKLCLLGAGDHLHHIGSEGRADHDLEAVLATLAKDAAVMGTGPGEMWKGKEELSVAYKHFFMVFDKGEQDFEYHFRTGELGADMGWMMTSGNVTGKRKGKDFAYPLNISISVSKHNGKWKIAAMHFSTLTGENES
jgi:ketosteroid isomerase-like protein